MSEKDIPKDIRDEVARKLRPQIANMYNNCTTKEDAVRMVGEGYYEVVDSVYKELDRRGGQRRPPQHKEDDDD